MIQTLYYYMIGIPYFKNVHASEYYAVTVLQLWLIGAICNMPSLIPKSFNTDDLCFLVVEIPGFESVKHVNTATSDNDIVILGGPSSNNMLPQIYAIQNSSLTTLTWLKLSVVEFLSDRRRATMTEGLRSDCPTGRSPGLSRPWAQPPWGSVWIPCTGTDTGMTRGTIVVCLPKEPSSCWGGKAHRREDERESNKKIEEVADRWKKRETLRVRVIIYTKRGFFFFFLMRPF